MFPRIPQHSFVLVAHWLTFKKLKPSETVLINHPEHGLLIKTIAFIDKNHLIWCKGENSSSISIEKLGPVSKKQILGRVIKVFLKPSAILAP